MSRFTLNTSSCGWIHRIYDWSLPTVYKEGVKFYYVYDTYEEENIAECFVRKEGDKFTLKSLTVRPDWRHMGIASLLINYVISKYKTLYVIPDGDDDDLVSFYKKFGFVREIEKTDPAYEEDLPECWEMVIHR